MPEEEQFGNPWILKNIYNYIEEIDNDDIIISSIERLRVIKEHLDLLIEEKGEYIAIREMRKHICWYIKNLKESSKVRETVNRLETEKEVIGCLTEYFKTL